MQQKQQQENQQQELQESAITPSNDGLSSPMMEKYIRPMEEGFEQVLRELKAGLRTSDESWQMTLARRNKKKVMLIME
jgi:hypothetical protein